jgi:hypothetical protein
MHEVCEEKRKPEKLELKQRKLDKRLARKERRTKDRAELNKKYKEELKKKNKNP